MALAYMFSSHNTSSFFIKLRIKRIIRADYTNQQSNFEEINTNFREQITIKYY